MTRRFEWVVLAFVTLLCVLARCTPPWEVNHDVGWYFYLADRVLQGDRLYVDVVEINPPGIVLFTMGVVAIAQGLGAEVAPVFDAVVMAMTLGCVAFSCRLGLLRTPLESAAGVALLSLWPGSEFGQREHLVTLALVPYLGACANPDASTWWRGVAGAVAALGFCLKPQFLLLPLLLANRARGFRAAEQWGPLVVLGVVGYHLVLPTVYMSQFTRFGVAYSATGIPTALATPWALLAIFATSLLAVVGRGVETGRGFLLCAVGAFVAAALQAKGFRYHMLPATTFACLGLTVVGLRAAGPRSRRAFAVALAVASLGFLAQHGLAWRDGALCREPEFDGIPEAHAAVRELREGDGVLVLDTDIPTWFAYMQRRGLVWASPFPHLWPLEGSRVGRGVYDPILACVRRTRPVWIFVREGALSFVDDPSFRLRAWIEERGPRGSILDGYENAGSSGGFSRWRRLR